MLERIKVKCYNPVSSKRTALEKSRASRKKCYVFEAEVAAI